MIDRDKCLKWMESIRMTMPPRVCVTVRREEYFTDLNLVDFMGELRDTFSGIPASMQKEAEIEFEGDREDGYYWSIRYWRPTDEDDVMEHIMQIAEREDRDRAYYKTMKERFE